MKKFHLIARAVVLKGGYVLLAHQKGAANTFLPGGHIEMGESAPAALKREIFEELGLDSDVSGYLGALEADWEEEEIKHYEINHIFRVAIKAIEPNEPPVSREAHLEFFWSAIEDLSKNNLLPHPLIPLIKRLAEGDESIWWESTLCNRGY